MAIVKRHEITDDSELEFIHCCPQTSDQEGQAVICGYFLMLLFILVKPALHGVIYQGFSAWCDKNYFYNIFKSLQEPDLEEVMIDSTCVKVHQLATGAQKKVCSLLEKLLED